MKRSDDEGLGGSFSVDGENIEIDLAEFGWPADRAAESGEQDSAPEDDGRVRLQKALAHAGVASRRACEALITGGRVTVNGRVQRELGSRIDPDQDDVRVDGVVVQLDVSKRYFVLNKPRGVVSTMSDENGRPDLREFTDQVAGGPQDREAIDGPTGAATAAAQGAQRWADRLYNVGRLDTDTSGLLILTNDGELAHKLAHPSFGVSKTYIAKVRGRMTAAVIQRLKDGVELSDGPIHADRAKLLPGGSGSSHSLVEITLHSGRNRIVRRMLAEVGHPVEELVRRQFGPLHLGTLRSGEMRELSAAERGALLSAAEDGDAGAGGRGSGSSAKRGAGSGRSGSGAGSKRDDSKSRDSKSRDSNGRDSKNRGAVTAGRPGDGKGARGMRGVAAKGNPHGRGGPGATGGGRAKPGSSGDTGGEAGGRGQNGQQGSRKPRTDGRKRNGR